MASWVLTILMAIFLFLSPALSFGLEILEEPKAAPEEPYVPGELLVKYRDTAQSGTSEYYRVLWGVSELKSFKRTKVHQLKLPKELPVETAIQIFGWDPDIEYAEPNYYLTPQDESIGEPDSFVIWAPPPDTPGVTPNDLLFPAQWGLHNTGQSINGSVGTPDADIDAPEAWEITTGTSGATDILVAVVDTGVDHRHPDLSPNIWTNPGETPDNGIDDDGNGYIDDVIGWDFVHNDNSPDDVYGHGTSVAGVIAAAGNNQAGIAGVSWGAKIMVLKSGNAFGQLPTSASIEAIEYANMMGAHVINCSWGGPAFSQALKDTIDASSALVVCSAGNEESNIDVAARYPASYSSPNLITAAASDNRDNFASFSNYGVTSVDVAAPGVMVLTTGRPRTTFWQDNFDDHDISNWATGGSGETWGVTDGLAYNGAYSLADSPSGDYQNFTDTWVRSPAINLSMARGTRLEFRFRGQSETGYDRLYVQVSEDQTSWTDMGIYIPGEPWIYRYVSGSSYYRDSWFTGWVDLGAFDGKNSLYIRFRFTTDYSVTQDGWYIDDVKLTTASFSPFDYAWTTGYGYANGTSFAAPHVAGIAALIKAQNPSLTNVQIKQAIENTVDVKSAFNGKVATGGRVNAFKALPPTGPSELVITNISGSDIDLSWTDNASNESGFRIERNTGSQSAWIEIGTVSENVTTYEDSGVTESEIQYRVRAYNAATTSVYSNTATADRGPPTATLAYSAPDILHVDVGTLTISATLSELPNGTPGITIDRPGAMSTIHDSMSGESTTWTYNLDILRHNGITMVDGPYTVSLTAEDFQGNALTTVENNQFITDTKDFDNDGTRDYEDPDDDNDGLPDEWEIRFGMNHQNRDDINGWDGDLDNDGWANWEEYRNGTDPGNPASPFPNPPVFKEVNPRHNSGITNAVRIPNNTAFGVRFRAAHGIDLTDASGVTLTIDDGVTSYTRSLNDVNASGVTLVRAVPLDSGATRSERLWVVYYRSNESGVTPAYPHGETIGVSVYATDIRRDSMVPQTFNFKIEGLTDFVRAAQNRPRMRTSTQSGITTVEVDEGDLEGAAILYDESVERTGVTPYFGPPEDIPALDLSGTNGVGAPVNLEPPAVFPEGVTLRIPCPGYSDVSSLCVYYYNGEEWVVACDASGAIQTGGDGWMIPGSRVNHNNGNPSTIEIQVYHFSAAIAGSPAPGASSSDSSSTNSSGGGGGGSVSSGGGGISFTSGGGGGGGGGGCFISTLVNGF